MFRQPITPTVKNLLFINIGMFVLILIMQGSNSSFDYFMPLHNMLTVDFKPFQFVTNMFTHFEPSHIFFNMLMLYFIGPMVEQRIGSKKLFIAYIVGGLLSSIIHAVVYSFIFPKGFYLLGASGAINTIFVLAGLYFSGMKMRLLFLPFEVPIGYLVAFFITIDILFLSSSVQSSTAHLAHLGGVLAGFILYYIWEKR